VRAAGVAIVKGLREEVGREIVRERGIRAFASIDDLKLRVPGLQKAELTALAEIGALNFCGKQGRISPAGCALADRAGFASRGTAAGRR